ncbi:MAG TPA: hypothetical protein VFF43_08510 [Caldimonas sp.]|nr:hypothetical protein [Caldimonas sp.]
MSERERLELLADDYVHYVAGLLVGSIRAITDDACELDVHTTGDGYLPSFTVRRGRVACVVHVEAEIVP